ncbi:hypothetical protein FF38_05200 [Lucilia cuprina]|uniref:Peptidase A2 domain-containing protein n=1 Tax=Lucilia cuprina TaxID=7375 RepID=A0A0L0CLF9_LUCCU|nr:hypothetical protein FF38_05200 [Lucilia cuprina]
MSTLLVDTGADISVIKRSQVLYDPTTENEKVNINGIGQGLITTIGKVWISSGSINAYWTLAVNSFDTEVEEVFVPQQNGVFMANKTVCLWQTP